MRRTWSVDWVLRGVLPALRWGRVGAFFFVCAAALVTLCGGLRASPRFLPEGAGFKGGQGTYEVRATVDHVEITPIEPSRSGAPPRGAPVRIETAAIARDRELYARKATGVTEGSARVEADGRLLIQRGEVVEELRSTEEGVEQSWIFDRRPEGTGELVVRLRVSGQEHTGHTKEGLRFTDPRTGLGVRCGPATWVDARGVRTPVSARYSEGQIELRVAEAALDGSAYPAVLDPVWEAEFGMGALGPLVDDTAIQTAPSIAFGKDSYLAVWADLRGSGAIRGARLSQDGEVLDKTGFTLSKGEVIETAVAYDGESYLVVWSGRSAQDSTFYVHGMLVDLDGKPLGAPVAFKHFAEAYPGGGVAIAYDSFEKSFLVVWSHPEEGIVGVRVTTDQGVPTPGAEIALSKPMTQPGALSVACDGERCLVAWWDTVGGAYGVYGSLVSSNSSVDLAISTDPDGGQSIISPAVSFDGIDHYLVLWGNKYSGIRGARVNRIDGAVVDPETPVAKGSDKTNPVLARSQNGRLFAAWMNSTGTMPEWAWIDTKSGIDTGEAMKVPSINKVFLQERPSLACAGNGTTCALMRPEYIRLDPQKYDFRQEIEAVLLHEASNTILPLAVTRNWVDQGDPAVVSREGSGFMIAWSDVYQEERVVLLPISDASQNPVDISKPSLAEKETFEPGPSIAWGDDNFLIAWTKKSFPSHVSIAGKILNQTGASIAEFEIPTDPSGSSSSKPDIVFDGLDYLITWMIPGSKYLVRVARQGVSGEASVVTVHAGGGTTYVSKDAGAPAIAHGGENSLIVWAENDIYAARIGMVNGELTTLDPDGIKVSDPIDKSSTSNLFLSPPDVASDGDGYLVIWRRPELAGGSRIYGSRVSRDGVRLDNSFPISPLKSTDVSCAKVTWDGHSYLVVWQDHEGGEGTMFSTWVSRNGVVSGEAGPFEVARTTNWNPESAVASDGAGKSLVAYVRSDLEVEGTHVDANRIRARYVDNPCMLPDVVECMADTECRGPGECIPHPGADGYTCAPSPPKPDGSACDGGMCFNGECIPDAATVPDAPAASGGTGEASQRETIGGCGCHIESSSEGGAGPISARVTLLAAALAVYVRRRRTASRPREAAAQAQGAFTPMARRRRRRDSFPVSSTAFSVPLSRV